MYIYTHIYFIFLFFLNKKSSKQIQHIFSYFFKLVRSKKFNNNIIKNKIIKNSLHIYRQKYGGEE